MEVGDGRSTRFWQDTWLQSGKLKDSFLRLYLASNNKGSVIGDCERELRQWETNNLNHLLDILQDVRLIEGIQDRMVWKFDKKVVYTTNSFMQALQVQTVTEDILNYKFTNGI
ncbi:hypothetical protein AHAS_Ahas11G0037300 [Arachis hypogaea]